MTGHSTLVCNLRWKKCAQLLGQDIKALGLAQQAAQTT